MKTWLFCLGMILIAQPLAAQTPAAPTNVVLNLTPTDSLGLFLPGYDVEAVLEFDVIDTLNIGAIHFTVIADSGNVVLASEEFNWQAVSSYYAQGVTVVRDQFHVWVELGNLPLKNSYQHQVRIKNLNDTFSLFSSGTVSP